MSPTKPWENWNPPRELDCPLPRPVRLTASGIASCLLSVLMIAGGVEGSVWLAGESRRQEAEARRVLEASVETEGVVTRLGHIKSFWVDYRFTAGGRECAGSARISRQHWNLLQAGGPIAVRYLPSHPATSFPSADPPYTVPLWFAYLSGVAALGAGAWMLCTVWLNRRRLAGGQPAPAVVTRVETRGRARRGTSLTVHYEFPLLGGGACQGKYYINTSPPPEGSVFCVLYDRDNPRRHSRYPSSLVKVAAS